MSETDGDEGDNDSHEFSLNQTAEFRKNKHPKFKRGLRLYLWSPSVNRLEDSESDDDFLSHAEMDQVSRLSASGFHLVQIVLQILQSIGEMDVNNHNIIGSTLSATILPHFLFLLKQFGKDRNRDSLDTSVTSSKDSGSEPWKNNQNIGECNADFVDSSASDDEQQESLPWSGVHRLTLLKQIVRAVLSLSGIVATQQNGVRILNNLKVVDTLLDE